MTMTTTIATTNPLPTTAGQDTHPPTTTMSNVQHPLQTGGEEDDTNNTAARVVSPTASPPPPLLPSDSVEPKTTASSEMMTPSLPMPSNASAEMTNTHIHLAKDSYWYETYEEKCDANKIFNEHMLRSKGLLEIKDSLTKKKASSPRNKKRKVSVPPPPVSERRRSNRLSNDPTKPKVELKMLDYYNDGEEVDYDVYYGDEIEIRGTIVPKKKKMVRVAPASAASAKPKKKKTKTNGESVTYEYTLKPDEIEKLQQIHTTESDEEWLDDMHYFLLHVSHGGGNKVISVDNAKSVMKQVTKLVMGEGITYHHWKSGTYFYKNVKIQLTHNMNDLYNEAIDYENKYGRDLGNGWLLRHPITKLRCYQEHRLSL